jgi:hypothetical protein
MQARGACMRNTGCPPPPVLAMSSRACQLGQQGLLLLLYALNTWTFRAMYIKTSGLLKAIHSHYITELIQVSTCAQGANAMTRAALMARDLIQTDSTHVEPPPGATLCPLS